MPNMSRLSVQMVALLMLVIGVMPVHGEEPAKVLADKGLERAGKTWVLELEKSLRKELAEVRKTYVDARKAQAEARRFDKKIRRVKAQIAHWQRQLEDMKLETRKAMTENQYNRLVEKINDLEKQITAAQTERKQREDKMNEDVEKALGAFSMKLLDLYDKLVAAQETYKSLAKNEAVTEAITAVNDAEEIEMKLGPSSSFDRQFQMVERMREEIKAGEIHLEKEGNSLWVDVRINGESPRQMVLDTGASYLSLPHDFAADLGIDPTQDSEDIQVSLADGKIVDAKLVVLKSVQIGQFIVKDVPTVVLPESLVAAPPLLGNSYLKNFVFRVDPEKGKLRLTERATTTDTDS